MKQNLFLTNVMKLPELDGLPEVQRKDALYKAYWQAALSKWGLGAVVAAGALMALVSYLAPSTFFEVIGHATAGAVGGGLWLLGIRSKLRSSGR